jgi:AcrR family transcriptional regulator
MAERMHSAGGGRRGDEGAGPVEAARERLRAVGLGYISFALDEPGWFEVAFAGAGALPGSVDEAALPAPLAELLAALDDLVRTGELTESARADAEWPCWSAVHGFALLALKGPLRARARDELLPIAERTVDTVIRGLLR